MGRYINEVTILGNVGGEPSVTKLQDGTSVAQMSIATSVGGYKKSDGTDVPQRTTWHRIVLWRSLADAVGKYVKKGARVMIKGSLETRQYTDKQNNQREVTEIVASDMFLFDKTQQSGQAPPPQNHFPGGGASSVSDGNDGDIPF